MKRLALILLVFRIAGVLSFFGDVLRMRNPRQRQWIARYGSQRSSGAEADVDDETFMDMNDLDTWATILHPDADRLARLDGGLFCPLAPSTNTLYPCLIYFANMIIDKHSHRRKQRLPDW